MSMTETECAAAADAVQCIENLTKYQAEVGNIDMKQSLQTIFETLNGHGIDGNTLLTEFVVKVNGLVVLKKQAIRDEFLVPFDITPG